MPNIADHEDSTEHGEDNADAQPAHGMKQNRSSAPVPPPRYEPSASIGHAPVGSPHGGQRPEFDTARRLIVIAQVMAVISLFFGGIFLSAAAFVIALSANRKVRANANAGDSANGLWGSLKRPALAAVVMSAIVLVENIILFAVAYPAVMEMLQSGKYASLFGDGPQAVQPGPNNSTWG